MPSPTTNGNDDQRSATKVFGIGLFRTGTTSLTHALMHLGYRTIHLPADEDTRREVAEYFDTGADAIHLTVLRDHDALTDFVVSCIYQGLDRAYPGSRFILTVRDKESWLDSCERMNMHIGTPLVPENADDPLIQYIVLLTKMGWKQTVGDDEDSSPLPLHAHDSTTPVFDRQSLAQVYDAYHQQVADYFRDRPDDLLTLNIIEGEGWEKLAPFLGQPIPEVPFPFEFRLRQRDEVDPAADAASPESGSAADSQARIDAVQAYVEAFRRRDLDSAVRCFTDDAVLKFLDRRVSGHDRIADWHRDRFKAGSTVVDVGAYETSADRVVVDLVVASKVLKRLRVQFHGRAAFRLAGARIQEMGLENIRLVR